MEIAYDQILLLLLQCLIIGLLLASLFRLRSIFGLGLLYIALGVFQFLQVFLASSMLIEVVSGIFISSGSMVLFSASLFMVLLVYIREDALEARKIIYALLAANLVTSLLLVVFGWSIDNDVITNLYNLPREFFSDNARILLVGTLIFIFDAFAIIFIYEFISKYIKSLFLRILCTMTLVLSLDSIFFALGLFYGKLEFQNILISGLIAKNLAAVIYSSLFTLYLVYFDTKLIKSETEADTFKDIFHKLTFRQKYEDVFTEMKNKSRELQEAQKMAQLGTVNLDLTTMQFNSSPIFDSIFGFNLEKTKKFTTYQETIHPDDLPENKILLANCIKTGKKFDREYRIFNQKTKKLTWIHGIGEAIYIEGEPTFFKGTVQDITKQKLAEQKLQASENRFHMFANSSFEGIGIAVDGILQDVNDHLSEMTGYSKKELIGSSSMMIIHPDDLKMVTDYIKKDYEGSLEFRILKKDGNVVYVEARGATIYYNGKNARIANLYDISDRIKIKERLLKSEEKFSKAYFNNPIPIFISSIPDGEFIDINPKFEEFSGRSRKELIGKKVTELDIYANEQDRLKLFKELENKGRLRGYEIEFKTESGEKRDCKMYSEIIDIDGGPCLISIVSDITKQKQSGLALEKKNKELTLLTTELSNKHNLLIESEIKFKNLFEKSPVSLWKEDLSMVKHLLDIKMTETSDLKKYLDENPDFVFECVSKVEILNVNDISLDLFGVKNRGELIHHLSKTFNDKSIEIFKKELLAIASNKKEFSGETEFIRSDGEIITTLINFLILDDNYEKAIVSIVDITELNRAKENIVESQRKFKKLFDKNSVSLWEVDFYEVKKLLDKKKTQTKNLKKYLDNNIDFVRECISKIEILDINEVSLDLMGANTKIELINTLGEKFNKKTIEVFKKQLIAIATNEREFSGETEFIKSSGEIITTFLKYVKINETSDIGIISIIDITALTSAKEEIVESEKKFRELYEKSGDAILIIENGVFVECNQATVDLLEYKSKEDFLASHPSKLSPILQPDGKKSFDKANEMMNESLTKGTHRFEWIHSKKNGTEFPVEVLLTAIANEPDNQIIHCVWRDITSRKQAEQSLVESENELQQSQEIAQLGTFNFNISTQVFTSSPIFNVIVGFKAGDKKTLETYKEITHPDDFEKNEKMLKECIKSSKRFDREYRIFNYSTKELIWLQTFGDIVYSERNEMNFNGTIQDITERKLIELKVKLSERKLKEIQKIANLGTYEIELNTNNIVTSKLYNSIFGIKEKPSTNEGWWKNITHPDDYEKSESLWQQSIKDCKAYSDEYRILIDNDEIRWIQDIAQIKGENGIATKVVGTVQDITIRKNAEEKIKRSDSILSQVNSLVQVVDKNGNITYASPSFKTILGFEPEDMLGQGWWIKTTSNVAAATKLRDAILNVVNNDVPIPDEIKNRWIKAKNGEFKLFEWINSKGEDDSLIFIGIDVTEKQERETQFKTLTETAQDAIILVDHNGLIFEWNKSSEETFGYSKQEIEGKSITALMPEKYRSQYQKGFNEVMQKSLKESYRNNIVEGLTKEGVVFPVELSLSFWESNNNYVYCYFIRDITQRERNEKIKELIFNITNKSNEALDLNKFFHYIKIELEKLINTDNFFIALYDEKTEMISTPYMVDELDIMSSFPKGKTLTGHVIDTKSAILTKEIILDPESDEPKAIGIGPESKCWLGVPMLVDNIVIGAIVVQSYTDENAYTNDDVSFLELVASNIGQAVKKAEDLVQIRLMNKALIQSPQAVIITNKIGNIEYVNPAFTEISGYSETEVFGKNPRILRSTKQLPKYYKNLWKTISKGKIWEGEFVNIHKDGSSYLVEVNISSVKNENGKITHYISVQEDITEKRKLERQFINAIIEAQDIEKQNFGEELHDGISQILSAESMYIDLLIEQNKDRINDKAKFLTKIKELNSSAINETRNIAHGLMSSQLKQSGLLISVDNICIDFSNKKNIEFKFVNDGVDEKELSQEIKINLFRVIQELSTNINRYSNATKAIISFSKLNKNRLKVIVKDNGVGMDYNKIKNEATGIGLQTVKRRIAYLNGDFDLETALNEGTSYTLKIPL